MTTTRLGRSWHIVTFVVVAVALVLQLALVVSGQNILDFTGVRTSKAEQVRRFFCYFTIQANALVAVSMFLLLRGRSDTKAFRVVRLASLVGIAVTGIVAFVALPPSPNYTAANLLCDRLLHVVVPALTVVGWVTFGPRDRVGRGDLLPALGWPVAWLVATLALGPLVDWYPYPFVDVGVHGLGTVLLTCVVIAGLFLALAAVALWADRRLTHRRDTIAG